MAERGRGGALAGKQVAREALRLFPKAIRDGGYFAATGAAGPSGDAGTAGLFTRRNSYRRAVARIDAAFIEAFRERGWLEADGDGRWVLAEAGRAWLRRQRAGAEPFREQHQARGMEMREDDGGARRPVLADAAESPLAWLRRRKGRGGTPLIGSAQFEAGERLRADYTRARLMPRVTAPWGAAASSRRSRRAAPDAAGNLTETALAARQRVTRALESVGPELGGMLVDVCCLLRGLEEAETARGWPRRSGKAILGIALNALARHYGLLGAAELSGSGPAVRPLRHWGSEDYRPTLAPWR